MFNCPECRIPLVRRKAGRDGVFWNCDRCKGRTATVAFLRRVADADIIGALWRKARAEKDRGTRPCPVCDARMAEVEVPGGFGEELVDVCRACHLVWFDPEEYERLPEPKPAAPAPPPLAERLSEADRRQLAMCEVALLRQKASGDDDSSPLPNDSHEWIAGFMGMPLPRDRARTDSLPIATWVLAAAILSFGAASLIMEDVFAHALGLIPYSWPRYGGLTLLTSFFVHAGLFHLGVNLYYLLLYGSAVELIEGRRRLLLLLAMSTLVGGLAHIVVDPSSTIPCVGASGGLMGLITYLSLEFPGLRVRVFLRGRFFKLPLIVLFFIWILVELRGLLFQIDGLTDISAAAHLGGAAAGILFWILNRRLGSRRP